LLRRRPKRPDAVNRAAGDVLDMPSVRERMEGLGLRVPLPEHRSPDHIAKLLPPEIEK
jgi:hypothetical protein